MIPYTQSFLFARPHHCDILRCRLSK